MSGERRGCAEDRFAYGDVDLDGIDSGGEFAFDEVFVGDDGGGGVVATELVDLALELPGFGDLGLDGGLLLVGLGGLGGGGLELALGE